MTDALLIQFDGLRKEREIVGKILIAYGELEFVLLDSLVAALSNAQAAVRTMFQLRSEANRLVVAEAIATPSFDRCGLGGHFKHALDAMNHCKAIRNNYAHCLWLKDNGLLRFANLEDTAKSKGVECNVSAAPLTLKLLRNQYAYFEYAHSMLLWVNQEYRKKNNQQPRGPRIPKPKQLPPPKLHSRGEERWQISISAKKKRPQ